MRNECADPRAEQGAHYRQRQQHFFRDKHFQILLFAFLITTVENSRRAMRQHACLKRESLPRNSLIEVLNRDFP